MRKVVSGEREIDRCLSCGAIWFDEGEIAELSEGRLEVPGGEAREPDGAEATLSVMHKVAPSLSCPRCGGALSALDFQGTGVPVLRCAPCRGILVPGRSALGLSAKFRFQREHRELYEEMGKSLAAAARRHVEREFPGPGGGAAAAGPPPLPILVPLADEAPSPRAFPIVTYLAVAISAMTYIFAGTAGTPLVPLAGIAALPSGSGLSDVPGISLLLYPFFHGGIVPLLVGGMFLFVLGDDVEDRLGWLPFLLFYLLCGAVSGAAHVSWGKVGAPAALGSAGAVAGVLGAYLVFFPNVPIRMYGLGTVASIPAYLFACTWVVAVFLMGMGAGPLDFLLNPAPLSLPGNVAGFGTGAIAAVVWRMSEDRGNPAGGKSDKGG